MTFNWGWLCAWLDRKGGFVRLGNEGAGLAVKCSRPLFSEREGYERPVASLGRWRLFVIRSRGRT